MLRKMAREFTEAFVDLICFTLTGNIQSYEYRYRDDWNDWLEKLPKDDIRTKEVYLEAGGVVAKVFLAASVSPRGCVTKASFRCRVLEIDGRPVPEGEQQKGEKKLDSFDCAPTREDEKEMLLEALQHFGIKGMPRIVDKNFLEDHLRFIKVRNRVISTERS
ncbi:MAG: hypothetical protein Q8R29_02630 [bacterium]|nr:hypothetical protein [bacterium]